MRMKKGKFKDGRLNLARNILGYALGISVIATLLCISVSAIIFFTKFSEELNAIHYQMNQLTESDSRAQMSLEQVAEQTFETAKKQQASESILNQLAEKIGFMEFIKEEIIEQEQSLSDPASQAIVSRGSSDNKGIVKQVLEVKGTAYDLSVASCGKERSHPQYGITYTGTRATVNRTVAVDPKVIPLKSTLYIEFPEPYQYLNGYRIAEDIGSGVKGKHIDIYMGEDKPGENVIEKQVNQFGVRKINVYIIDTEQKAIQEEYLKGLYEKLEALQK